MDGTDEALRTANEGCGTARAAAVWGWGRRVTVGAFWFFLVKGLAWLAVPAVVAYYAGA